MMVKVRFNDQPIQVRVDGAALALRQAALAQAAADFAEGFTGPVYASVSAGEAATTEGQIFRVSNGDGPPETTTAYRRTSGGSVEQAPLATTAALASTEAGKGAGMVALESGETVQEALDAVPGVVEAASSSTAFIDFTTKPDGPAPSVMDSGQAVVWTANGAGNPVIVDGRLVPSGPFTSGSYADYFQSDLGAPVRRVGCEWTMPAEEEVTETPNITYAAWAGIFGGAGFPVPASWCHMSINTSSDIPGKGRALWYVCDGDDGFYPAKTQYFDCPPRDGRTRWVSEAVLDVDARKGYAWLPDGTLMTLTNDEIADIAALGGWPVIELQDVADTDVILCEHFTTADADQAVWGGITSFFGETAANLPSMERAKFTTPLAIMKRMEAAQATAPAVPVSTSYLPTPALSVATTASMTAPDAANCRVTGCKAGPTGGINIQISAFYEWTATDTLFWDFVVSTAVGMSPTADIAVEFGESGQARTVTLNYTIRDPLIEPGSTHNVYFRHRTGSAGSATFKAGGGNASASAFPPFSILATPV